MKISEKRFSKFGLKFNYSLQILLSWYINLVYLKLHFFYNFCTFNKSIFRTSWKNVKEVFIQKLTKVIGNFHDESEYTEGKINNNCENLKFDDMKKILIEKAMSFEKFGNLYFE